MDSTGCRGQEPRARWLGLLALLLLTPAWIAQASHPKPQGFVTRIETPPEIDGRLDDPVWASVEPLSALVQTEPVEGGVPSERTEVRIATDGKALYLAIRSYDAHPDKIIAQKMKRDADLITEDRISLAFDTFHDRRNGYFFQLNAAGSRRDGLIEGPRLIDEWDGIWRSRARIDAQGWTVEIEFPFETFSFDPSSDTWGFNFLRAIRRNNELLRWAAPHPNISFINMAEAGEIHGLTGANQGIGLDVMPGATTRYVNDGVEDREFVAVDPGFDAFYKITPAVTSVVTVNTDFADAEVDERQVNLSRFALFFPEQREFFLQDAGIFEFANLDGNGRPFFSRRIGLADDGAEVPIRAGGKVTGRIGPLNIGFLDVQTGGHTLELGPDPHRVHPRNLAVGRVALNVLDESTLGAIVTNGDPSSNDANTVWGLDFNYRNSEAFGNRVVAGRGWFQRSEGTGEANHRKSYGARVEYPNDIINWTATAQVLEKDFDPALGFVNRVGIRQYDGLYRFRHRPEGVIRTIDHQTTGFAVTDFDGTLETGLITLTPINLDTRLGDGFELRYERGHENLDRDFEIQPGTVIPEDTYARDTAALVLRASGSRPLGGSFEVSWGGFFSGRRLRWLPTVDWRPSRHIFLSATYEENRVGLPEGDFTVRIVRGRVEINFSPDVSWITLTQYDNASDQLGINSRLRWIVRDGREMFLVFNQNWVDTDDRFERGRSELAAKIKWTFRF